jgi:uncharacterized damage-inducible protein DinB
LNAASPKKMATPFKNDYACGPFVRKVHGRTIIEHNGGMEGFSSNIKSCALVSVVLTLSALLATAAPPVAAAEYAKHFRALAKLSVAVADAMPAERYGFRPHSESMTFGELMSHIAATNYQFCAGLKDADPPDIPSPAEKTGVLKLLSDSFDYCSTIIPGLTEEQLSQQHNSPDGRLPGREVLLAVYIHVSHHRGQAEIYLNDNGIKPPPYTI